MGAALQPGTHSKGWTLVPIPSSDGENTYSVFVAPWGVASENICGCKAYEYRGHCRHQKIAADTVEEAENMTQITDEMERTASLLGMTYKEWKDAEKAKNEHKDQFFKMATENLSDDLAQRVVDVVALTPEIAASHVAKRYVGWKLVDLRPHGEQPGMYEAIIEELPEYKPFTYINKADGMVYSKQIAAGAIMLDDEAMADLNPDLYEKVTEEVTQRALRPLDDLTPEELAAIQPYIYYGKPTIKLAAPKKAKPEEIEEA